MNGSSLLSEEGERGSFILNPLIRQYVRFDAGAKAQVCQDFALRAVHGIVLHEQGEEPSTGVLSEQVTIPAILKLATHAIAVVGDQVDARKLGQAEEQKFVEVAEPLGDVTVPALTWSGRAVAAEALCTSLLEFLGWAQMGAGHAGMFYLFDGYFQAWQELLFYQEENSGDHKLPNGAVQCSHRSW